MSCRVWLNLLLTLSYSADTLICSVLYCTTLARCSTWCCWCWKELVLKPSCFVRSSNSVQFQQEITYLSAFYDVQEISIIIVWRVGQAIWRLLFTVHTLYILCTVSCSFYLLVLICSIFACVRMFGNWAFRSCFVMFVCDCFNCHR